MLAYILLIASLSVSVYAESLEVVYAKNIPKDVQYNADLLIHQRMLSVGPHLSAYRAQQLSDHLARLIEEAARPYGYFSAQCHVKSAQMQPKLIYHASCQMNQPVRIADVQIQISGPGADTLKKKIHHKDLALKPGQVFRADQYDQVKNELTETAHRFGYVDATTESSKLEIDVDRRSAVAKIHIDTREIYSFGNIFINQDTYSRAFLRSMAPFRAGAPFNDQQIVAYKSNLESSNLFTYISVLPSAPDHHSRMIPTQLSYEPVPKLQYGLGVGYSSDSDFFYNATIQRNRLSNTGMRSTTELLSSTDYSYAITTLSVPITHPTKNYVNFKTGYRKQEIDNVGTDRSVTTSVSHILQDQLDHLRTIRRETSLNYSIDHSKFDDSSATKLHFLYPSLQYDLTIRSEKNTFNAVLMNAISGNIKALMAPTDFIKFALQQKFNYHLDAQKLIAQIKTRQGYIATAETSDRLPLSWFFYTGGAYSVRGFAYNSIGADPNITNDDNNFLYTASFELQRLIFKDFYGIIFIDSGDATREILHSQPSYAIGTGILWKTFAGNFEVSVAKPVKNYSGEQSMKPRLNINIYQPL